MSRELDNWLTEHREQLLPRWVLALERVPSPVNGDGVGYSTTNETEHTPEPFLSLKNEEMRSTLTHIYEGLVLAAQGDLAALDRHLQTITTLDGQHLIRLSNLLSISFHFRRLAWDVLQQDLSNPSQTFALMNELENLLEHTVEALARTWQNKTDAEIRERISQAEFIAESMASAIEQADRTALQLSSLNEASHRLAASLEDTNQIIDQVGTTLLELLGPTHISIWFPDEETDPETLCRFPPAVSLSALRTWGENRQDVQGMHLDGSAEDDCLLRSFLLATTVFHLRPDPSKQGAWYQQGCGVLIIPIIVKERATGVILLQDEDPEMQFSRSQQDLARALVNQSAIALENSRLYAKIRTFNSELEKLVDQRTSELQAEKDRLATIHEIATEISSTLDLDNLLQTSLAALARITRVEYGSIMLVDPETENLVNRAVLGHQKINKFTRFPIGSGVAGWVAQNKEPALILDVTRDERWVSLPAEESMSKHEGSMVAVPLIGHNEVSGVLILSHSQPGYFNEDHLRLLTASAGAIAIGINNANMYNTIFEEMERSSELLQRQNAETSKMEAILQSLSDGVLVCDTEGAILSANPAAGRILQRDIEDLFLGTTLHDVLHSLLGARVGEMPLDNLLLRPLDNRNEPRVSMTTVEVNMRVISMTLGPVLTNQGDLLGALLLMHDITREVEADRLKTEFIGTMSHELRTPMTAIKGFTQLLAMGGLGPVNDTQREFLTTIQNNAERMISIINDVLDITKIETGSIDLELRPIHLAEVLSGVVTELQNLIQKREHNLTISIPPGLSLVQADVSRLHQVLYNLISNAAKYTPVGGEISVEAHEAALDKLPPSVRESIIKGRKYVQMNIHDTGVGIAPHEVDLIFDRFYRTENPLKVEAGGTGLGLSLVRPLVELLGGRIWVQSVLNEGSTFSFILPAIKLQ